MINCRPMFFSFGLITAAAFVGGCFVHPTSVVVTVGETVLLTCSTTEGSFITSWDKPINMLEKTTIYTAPFYKPDGTIWRSETLAKGYVVTRSAENETTLQMNKTILSQAGLYACTCALQSTAATTVVVLDSEPKFATDNSVTDGKLVTFSCSMSFNASSDVSCDLKIEDASGSTVTKENDANVNNGLIVCNLKHTVIANASSDQWYTCKVTLSTKGSGIIYTRVLNATVEWQLIRSAADILPNGDVQAERGEETSQKLAIGLSVTIFVVVVIIAAVVYFIIRSKNRDEMLIRQRSMEQSTDQSSNCPQRPANRYDKNKIENPIPTAQKASCHEAAQQDNQSLKKNELILCENDLYDATPKQLDPSDGYYAEEVVYNEVE